MLQNYFYQALAQATLTCAILSGVTTGEMGHPE